MKHALNWLTVAGLGLTAALAVAAPEEIRPVQTGTHVRPVILDTITAHGATADQRATPLRAAEAGRPALEELPEIDADDPLEAPLE